MAAESQPIVSSAIARLTYDADTQECSFTFTKGGTYSVTLDPIEVYRWVNAESPGGYFNNYIKDRYTIT